MTRRRIQYASEDTTRRGTQTDATRCQRQRKAYRPRNVQHTQQQKETLNDRRQHRERGRRVMVEEKNGFGFGLCVLVVCLKRMRMHHNDPVHHMRVGTQRHASPIYDEQQGKNIPHYATHFFQ